MKREEFNSLVGAFSDIDTIDHLERMVKSNMQPAFFAMLRPNRISFDNLFEPNCHSDMKFSRTINDIIMESLIKYRDDLKMRMENLEVHDNLTMPISEEAEQG